MSDMIQTRTVSVLVGAVVVEEFGLAETLDHLVDKFIGHFLDAQCDLRVRRAAARARVPLRVVDELAIPVADCAPKCLAIAIPPALSRAA
jgi:hypothetical protein